MVDGRDLDALRRRPMPETCEDRWHVSRDGSKWCDCGEQRNPSYRNWWQRLKDRRHVRKVLRDAKGL